MHRDRQNSGRPSEGNRLHRLATTLCLFAIFHPASFFHPDPNGSARVICDLFFERPAFAEGEGEGGGEGKEGEDGKKDGMQAAMTLMGIAMIIKSIAPMLVAAIQAGADVNIAKINAKAQLTMTSTTADTSKYLANKQEEIALTQAGVAKEIAVENNDQQRKRLDDQLAELRNAREDTRQADREKQAIEQHYNQVRIDLAVKASNDNVRLARETENAQLTQAGLISGFSASSSQRNPLSVSTTTASGQLFAKGNGTGVPAKGGGSTGAAAGEDSAAGAGNAGNPGSTAEAGGTGELPEIKTAGSSDTALKASRSERTERGGSERAWVSGHSLAAKTESEPLPVETRRIARLLAGLLRNEPSPPPAGPRATRHQSPRSLQEITWRQFSFFARTKEANIAARQLRHTLEKNLFVRGSTPAHRLRFLSAPSQLSFWPNSAWNSNSN